MQYRDNIIRSIRIVSYFDIEVYVRLLSVQEILEFIQRKVQGTLEFSSMNNYVVCR